MWPNEGREETQSLSVVSISNFLTLDLLTMDLIIFCVNINLSAKMHTTVTPAVKKFTGEMVTKMNARPPSNRRRNRARRRSRNVNLENKVCHMGRVIAFVRTSIISF
jgi:hypothetical protein